MKGNIPSKFQIMRERVLNAGANSKRLADSKALGAGKFKPKLPYFAMINSIKIRAMRALNSYYERRAKHLRSNSELVMNSLSECYSCLKQILGKFIAEREFETAIFIYQLLAEVAMFAKDYPRAIKYYTQSAYIAETYKSYSEQAEAYENIGRCYLAMRKYDMAILMFKWQLNVGWLCKKAKVELRAYDNIGMTHYYLGNIQAAKYYHYRMAKSMVEPFDSPYRKAFIYNEKKLRQRLDLERRGLAAYKQLMHRPRPIVTEDKEALAGALEQEVKLCTQADETPRVILDDPWKLEGLKDLPSPRSRSVYKEEVWKGADDDVIPIKINRNLIAARNRMLSESSKASRHSLKFFNRPTTSVTSPTATNAVTPSAIYFTHLNGSRNPRFNRSLAVKEFTKTHDMIDEIPHFLARTYGVVADKERTSIIPMGHVRLHSRESTMPGDINKFLSRLKYPKNTTSVQFKE